MQRKAGHALIEIRNVSKRFGELKLLDNVSLTVNEGETVVLIGPSGHGKSVLVKICAGLVVPDEGEVFIGGESITKARGPALDKIRRRMGMLFQNYALFDSMTVFENLAFPLRTNDNLSEEEITKRVMHNLGLVKLSHAAQLRTSELSGGMKKRVGIARAWIRNPEVILYDEPTAGLDPVTGERINTYLKEFAKHNRTTALVVTQEMLSAFSVATRLAFVYGGKVMQCDTPEKMRTSTIPEVRQFINGLREGPLTNAGVVRRRESM